MRLREKTSEVQTARFANRPKRGANFPSTTALGWLCAGLPTAHVPSWHYEYIFTMPELAAAWEQLLEFGEGFLGETLLEFRGRDVVEVF